MVGKCKVLIIVLALLFVGALMAALAPNLGVLILARVFQGVAGAIMPLSWHWLFWLPGLDVGEDTGASRPGCGGTGGLSGRRTARQGASR